MPGKKKCSYCGEEAVEWDETEGHQVCTECGIVVSQACFQGPLDGYKKYDHAKACERRISNHQVECLSIIEVLQEHLSLDTCTTDQAVNLFKQMLAVASFKVAKAKVKVSMAACCVFVACRLNSQPVTSHDIHYILNKDLLPKYHLEGTMTLSASRRLLKEHLNVSVADPPIDELIAIVCTIELSKDAVKMIKELVDIMDKDIGTMKTFWSHELIICSSYLVCQSVDVAPVSKRSYIAFRRKYYKTYIERTASNALDTLITHLYECAKLIPWITVKSKNQFLKILPYHLNDIVKCRRTYRPAPLATSDKRKCDDDVNAEAKRRKMEELDEKISREFDLDAPEIQENIMSEAELDMYINSKSDIDSIETLKEEWNESSLV